MHVYTYLLFLWGVTCVGSLVAQPTSTEDQKKQAQQARERRERVAGLKRAEEAREKRESNRVPVPFFVQPATPAHIAMAPLPPRSTVRASCKKEQVGVCIKRRCKVLNAEEQKEEEESLRPYYGDAWKEVNDQLHTFWALLLHAADLSNAVTLAPFVAYPFQITVQHHNAHNLWITWDLQNKDEFRRVFPVLMRVRQRGYSHIPCEDAVGSSIRHNFVARTTGRKICSVNTQNLLKEELLGRGGYALNVGTLFTDDIKVEFSVKTLPVGKRTPYTYKVIIEEFYITSSDFFNDIGRIRYELKRKGYQKYP